MNSNRIITLLEIVQQELERQRTWVNRLRSDAEEMRGDPQRQGEAIVKLLAATDLADHNRRAAESALDRAIAAIKGGQHDG